MRSASVVPQALAGICILGIAIGEAAAEEKTPRSTASELRVLPTTKCLWSEYSVSADRSVATAIFEALAPGLIDTGVTWIGEILKEAGERKVVPRYGATSLSAGPDFTLPSCLQLVYGNFMLTGTQAFVSDADVTETSKKLYENLAKTYFATDGQNGPDFWLELEIRYFPIARNAGDAYQSPTAYALVPTKLLWNRSIVSGKTEAKKDLLVFVNVAAPATAANEATTGFSDKSASVARLSWYGLSAGRPAMNAKFVGQPDIDGIFNDGLPPTASAWAPFPAIDKNQPLVIWANVTEARDGIKAFKKLGEALSARKAEVSTAIGNAVLPSNREKAETAEQAAEVTSLKGYITTLSAARVQAETIRQECKKYHDAITGGDAAAISGAKSKVIEAVGVMLDKIISARDAGRKLSPPQDPYSDEVIQELTLNQAKPEACDVEL